MIANGLLKSALCSGALAALALAPMLLSTPAEAQRGRGGASTYEEVQITTPGPVKGYSGSPVGAGSLVYCDYQRTPNRQCTIGLDGKERCKIVSWTLTQYCY
jgi:hypothetical protein